MEYKIRRTSGGYHGGKPHKDAYQRPYIYTDTRTTDDPAKVPMHLGKSEWWYEKGTNHRIEDGKIKRDLHKESGWFIQVEDIHQFLRDLYKEEETSEIVLSIEDDMNPPMLEIEIYDDYRE